MPLPSPTTRLINLSVDEAALVDKGDDPQASVVFFKRHREVPMPTLDDLLNKADPAIKTAFEAALSERDTTLVALKAEVDALKAAAPVAEPTAPVFPPEVQALLAKRDSELADLRKQVDDEREIRRTAQFMAKASKYSHLGMATADLASMLKTAADKLDGADYDRFVKTLDTTEAVATESSAMFKQVGRTIPSESADASAYGKIRVLAKQLAATDPTLSVEKAVAKVCEQNPKLYAAYLNENPAQTHQGR